MEIVYNVLETILPFNFMSYSFMKNALIAVILISPIFAILGTMIVNNKMAFFSDALRTFCINRNCNRNDVWSI